MAKHPQRSLRRGRFPRWSGCRNAPYMSIATHCCVSPRGDTSNSGCLYRRARPSARLVLPDCASPILPTWLGILIRTGSSSFARSTMTRRRSPRGTTKAIGEGVRMLGSFLPPLQELRRRRFALLTIYSRTATLSGRHAMCISNGEYSCVGNMIPSSNNTMRCATATEAAARTGWHDSMLQGWTGIPHHGA